MKQEKGQAQTSRLTFSELMEQEKERIRERIEKTESQIRGLRKGLDTTADELKELKETL